jgi:hypothetical protein
MNQTEQDTQDNDNQIQPKHNSDYSKKVANRIIEFLFLIPGLNIIFHNNNYCPNIEALQGILNGFMIINALLFGSTLTVFTVITREECNSANQLYFLNTTSGENYRNYIDSYTSYVPQKPCNLFVKFLWVAFTQNGLSLMTSVIMYAYLLFGVHSTNMIDRKKQTKRFWKLGRLGFAIIICTTFIGIVFLNRGVQLFIWIRFPDDEVLLGEVKSNERTPSDILSFRHLYNSVQIQVIWAMTYPFIVLAILFGVCHFYVVTGQNPLRQFIEKKKQNVIMLNRNETIQDL